MGEIVVPFKSKSSFHRHVAPSLPSMDPLAQLLSGTDFQVRCSGSSGSFVSTSPLKRNQKSMKISEKDLISCERRLITEPGVIPRAFDINRKLNHHNRGATEMGLYLDCTLGRLQVVVSSLTKKKKLGGSIYRSKPG